MNENEPFFNSYSLANYQRDTKKKIQEDIEVYEKELTLLQKLEAEAPERRRRIQAIQNILVMYKDITRYGGKGRKTRSKRRRS